MLQEQPSVAITPYPTKPKGLYFIIVLLLVFLVALGIYSWSISVQLKDIQSTDKTSEQVGNELAQEESVATTTDIETSTQQYTNDKYHFSLLYPNGWVLTENSNYLGRGVMYVGMSAEARADGTDRPDDISLTVTDYVKPLGYPNFTPEYLLPYLREAEQNGEYKNISAVTAGGRPGYRAEAGDNTFGGGIYYFVPQIDKSIIRIWDFAQSAQTATILESLIFP